MNSVTTVTPPTTEFVYYYFVNVAGNVNLQFQDGSNAVFAVSQGWLMLPAPAIVVAASTTATLLALTALPDQGAI